MITSGAPDVVLAADIITAKDNLIENAHPFVSAINAWITRSDEIDRIAYEDLLPSDTYLPGFQPNRSSVSGDAFLFDTPEPSDFTLNIILNGVEAQWNDTDCGGVEADGVDGDTLGCIAAGFAWLTYAAYISGGLESTAPTRSLSSSNHSFHIHSDWKSVGNCTTTCVFLSQAPEDTWNLVGNVSYIYSPFYREPR